MCHAEYLRYPGQYFDQESGLHYNYYRTYDPQIGRYLEPDPIGLAGGLNLYNYVNHNPANYTDALGLESPSYLFPNDSNDDDVDTEKQLLIDLALTAIPGGALGTIARYGIKGACKAIGQSLDDLSRAAAAADKGGFTKAGRSLQKHGSRIGSKWNQTDIDVNKPVPSNARAQDLVDDILTAPGSKIVPNPRGGIDAIAPDGCVVRYNRDGTMQGLGNNHERQCAIPN